MTSEVIIDVQPKEISIALLEDKSLVEYQNEPREASYAVGNIYVGKVRKLMPGPGHKARKNAQRREFDRRQERLVAKSRVRVEHQPQNGDDDRNQRRKHEKQDQFIDKKTLEFHRFTLPSVPL